MRKRFLVDLKDLAHEKISFQASFEPGVVEFGSENVQQVGPLHWMASAERAGNEIRITGSLNTSIELPCSRCLEPARIVISKPFDLFFREREEGMFDEDEEIVQQCIEVIRSEQKASVSLLQRRLRLGYTRAARIMDELENRGIVGPNKGAEPRDILIDLDGTGADGAGQQAV